MNADNPSKTFMDGFKSLCSNRNQYPVWADFWELSAISIANSVSRELYSHFDRLSEVWNDREDRYLQIAKRYKREELETMAGMLASMAEELERNPWQDFAGQAYMELGISNKNAGQFFTPYSVCSLSAEISAEDISNRVKEQGWYTVYDCACGGGAMLIAACQHAENELKPLNWQNHVMCVANDIDLVCVCMCYVQLSLLGVAGMVTRSDALRQASVDFYKEPENVWLTPMYLSDVWAQRRFWHRLDMNMQLAK